MCFASPVNILQSIRTLLRFYDPSDETKHFANITAINVIYFGWNSFPGVAKPLDSYGPGGAAPSASKDEASDDDDDLFGDSESEEEDEETKRRLAEYAAKKSKST